MKESYVTTTRLKSGESPPIGAATDFIRNSAGEIFTPAGNQLVHAGNINTVLASAGGAGWEKVQITTAAYQLKPAASGASRDFHLEAGGSLAALVVADWPIPASPKVDIFKIRNFSGGAVVFSVTVGAGQFSGIVTADDDPATPAATSYSIRNDGMVVVSIDSDGWVQVVPSAEVSQAEFDALGAAIQASLNLKQDASTAATDAELTAHTGNVSNPHTVTKTQVQLGNVDNTADTAKPVSTAQQTALDAKAPLASPTFTGTVSGITKAMVGLGSADNTADASKPVSTAQQTALDGKQATLVSGTNLRSVNGSSLLGAGNIAVAADLPGGTATTVTNEGLVTTGSPSVDTATVPGETIIRWTGAGNFTVPVGVTNVRVLAVAGGGGGGGSTGGGGGAGGMRDVALVPVSAATTYPITVGAGGAAGGGTGGNGSASSFGALTTTVGGGGGASLGAAGIGGSGGGGAGSVGAAGGAGTTGEGNAGGNANTWTGPWRGAGGGGAGSVGTSSSSTVLGNGGTGSSSDITGAAVFYAGGGGGGTFNEGGSNFGTGGSGVGGNGAAAGNGAAGATNKGGGGGGAGNNAGSGGAGGSGVVIVRFATQTRSYQALQSYANNAAAITAGRLVGEFFVNTATGGIAQVV